MTALSSYSSKAQNLIISTMESVEYRQHQVFTASTEYAGNLASIFLSGTKYKDPGAYAFGKLLAWSKFLNSYTSVVEALDDLAIDMDLEEFQGEF